MIVYLPTPIASAEQAEQLPLWTVATIERHPSDGLPQLAMRIVRGWRNRDIADGRIPHADMIGWTALVPVEAEEEEDSSYGGPDYRCVRAVTPWQIIARPSQDRRGDCA